jgi:hypothetical protein
VASLTRLMVAFLTFARRIPDILSKQSFGIRQFLSESPRSRTLARSGRAGKVSRDFRSAGQFVREYLIPMVVSVSLGCMAIADGLALPWSATIAVMVGLGVHMAMQMPHQ